MSQEKPPREVIPEIPLPTSNVKWTPELKRQLPTYAQAREWLNKCASIDEVKKLRDQTEALRAYAVQVNDNGLAVAVEAIKARATWELGIRISEMKKNPGTRGQLWGRDSSGARPLREPEQRRELTLRELGISLDLSARSQKLAELGEPKFNSRVRKLTDAGIAPTFKRLLDVPPKTQERTTPVHVVELVEKLFGEIQLDVCADAREVTPAGTHYKNDEGLTLPWPGKILCMPSARLGEWARKFAEEYEREMTEGVLLVSAKTDQAWFQYFSHADARLSFINVRECLSSPSVAIYLGPNGKKFVKLFRPLGPIFQPVTDG